MQSNLVLRWANLGLKGANSGLKGDKLELKGAKLGSKGPTWGSRGKISAQRGQLRAPIGQLMGSDEKEVKWQEVSSKALLTCIKVYLVYKCGVTRVNRTELNAVLPFYILPNIG